MRRAALRFDITSKDQTGIARTAERRSTASSGCVAGSGAAATGQGRQRAAGRRSHPHVCPGHPQAGHRYEESGLAGALYEKQRPGAAELLDDSQKQRIIAMVCSDPPEGRARWTVRLVAEEAIKRRLVPSVGRETIRVLLLHHDLKPWREKNVERGRTH